MISSIPLFTNGILQRTLIRDLEQHQINTASFPGYITIDLQLPREAEARNRQERQMLEIVDNIPYRIELPVIARVNTVQFGGLNLGRDDNQRTLSSSFVMRSNMENHIELLYGRMYEPGINPVTNTREVMVTETMLQRNMLTLGGIYPVSTGSYYDAYSEEVEVVGVFAPIDGDPYWQHMTYAHTFFLPYESLEELNELDFSQSTRLSYMYIFDYHAMKINQVDSILTAIDDIRREIQENFGTVLIPQFRCSFASTVEKYAAREENLRYLLQILYIPILIMILYYVFMVARLKIHSEEAIIAVLRSRGASGRQILWIYFLEVLILGIAALIIGIPLGWGMCRILGSSNGFLDFVSRAALPLEMSVPVYIYSAIAFFGIVFTTLAPAFKYSRTSIVEQKQKSARPKQPFWKRLFLDVLLLGVSLYYLYLINEQTDFYRELGLAGTEGSIDMTIYLASTVFAIGAGLCFLRIYPYLISLIYRIGRRFWSPVFYATLHTIKNSGGAESFLMLFIILSLSVGLFSAGAARTINRNVEDRIRNSFGADVITQQYWAELDEHGRPVIQFNAMDGGQSATEVASYVEPSFVEFRLLDGVDGVARVALESNVRLRHMSTNTAVTFMAFDPYDFAQTAWWRPDLAPHGFNEYMNIMIDFPSTIILSESLRDLIGVREGDRVRLYRLPFDNVIDLDVLAFVDFWPAFNPFYQDPAGIMVRNHLVVANLEFLFSRMPVFPYDVWIRKAPNVSDEELYDQLAEMRTPLVKIESITKLMVEAKNDPALQGTNGALSLGFIIAMMICGMGFLIYWILSINSRILQFGVMRAMGMTRRKIFYMLICEQFLVSGVALMVGIAIGNLAVSLFVPIFSLLYSGDDQNIPFRIYLSGDDSLRIYLVFGIVMLCCLLLLGHILRRINIDQALKLGED